MESFIYTRRRSPRAWSPVRSWGRAGAFPRGPVQRRAHTVNLSLCVGHWGRPRGRCSGRKAGWQVLWECF